MEVVIPQETVVLKQTLRRIHFSWKNRGARRCGSEEQTSVGPLPRGKAARRKLSL